MERRGRRVGLRDARHDEMEPLEPQDLEQRGHRGAPDPAPGEGPVDVHGRLDGPVVRRAVAMPGAVGVAADGAIDLDHQPRRAGRRLRDPCRHLVGRRGLELERDRRVLDERPVDRGARGAVLDGREADDAASVIGHGGLSTGSGTASRHVGRRFRGCRGVERVEQRPRVAQAPAVVRDVAAQRVPERLRAPSAPAWRRAGCRPGCTRPRSSRSTSSGRSSGRGRAFAQREPRRRPSDVARDEVGGGLVGERLAGLVVADDPVEPLVRDLVGDEVGQVRRRRPGRDPGHAGPSMP